MPRLWISVVVGLGLCVALADGRAGLRAWWTLRSDAAEAEARVAALRGEIQTLERDIEALGADSHAIEAAIRADLELARRGEVVVRVPLPSDAPTR
ncbi:MAG: septum formation initiator family protein [Myxococcota bacterium]